MKPGVCGIMDRRVTSEGKLDGAHPHRNGHSTGEPAGGEHESPTFSPTGGPGLNHWKRSTISEPGLEDRGDVFFAAIEMTRMPMILTDPRKPDNPIVFANNAFFDLTGYTEEEIVGRNCRFLQGAKTDPDHVSELREAVEAKRAVSVEILNYKRDGTPFWNAVYIAPVFGPGDELLYFFASQLDITRRRSSEQAFRQAQKMESIGQLTAGLAHDFNNLLQVVSGNLELLMAKLTDEKMLRHADAAAGAAERGARLTKQLLAFARKTMLDPKPASLNDLVVEFGDLLESTAGPAVDLEFNLKRRVPACSVDRVHLEMALLNVLINARDAMPKGGTVTIGTSSMRLENGSAERLGLPAGEYAVLSVADEGEGMPPHVLERATEPFFTTKPQGKGTGLGLAMVHGFVQQSLGRLEVDSEVGRGTTIRMIFPVAGDGAAPARKPAAAGGAARREDPRGSAETILVVEDSEDVLALAREHLEGLGYRVLTARNGDEGLRVFEQERDGIDLVFTDIVMPGGVNGVVLAERVRARKPGLPVVLTTGYNEQMVADGPSLASSDVLGKPYNRTQLADRIRAALNSKAHLVDRRAPRPTDGNTGPRHEA